MENKVTSYFIRQALIYSGIMIAITLILYMAGTSFFCAHYIMLGIGVGLIAIIYPIIALVKYRRMNEGFMTLKEGFYIAFFILAIAGLISGVFSILLNLFDTSYSSNLANCIVDNTREMMEKFGAVDEDRLAKVQVDVSSKFTPSGQIRSYLFGLIFYAVYSVILALILKKQKPLFASTDDQQPS